MRKTTRQLQHSKSTRVTIGEGVPSPNEGSSGDLTLRMIKTGIKLYAKFRDKWYIVGDGNLNQSAGENQDILIAENRKKVVNSKQVLTPVSSKLDSQRALNLELNADKGSLDIKSQSGYTFIYDGDPKILRPQLVVVNETDDATSGAIVLKVDRNGKGTEAGQDNDTLGTFAWSGFNDASPSSGNAVTFASIFCQIIDASDGSESAKLQLQVVTKDAGSAGSGLEPGLMMIGSDTNDEVDVTIGNGAASLTTIAGNIDIDGDTITSAGALEIDAGGTVSITGQDIDIDAARQLNLSGGGDTYLKESDADKLDFYVGADKMFTLDEANDKITMGATNWVAGTVSGGTVTEFSAANSAYAGMILGYTNIGLNEVHATHTLTTSYTVPTDEFSVSFTAPPSGNVEIFMQIWFHAGTSGAGDLYAGLSTANATSGYSALQDYYEEALIDGSGRYAFELTSNLWTLTGLTAGTAYEYWVGFKSTGTTGIPYIRWGGNSSNRNPDFIMKATALPATITT